MGAIRKKGEGSRKETSGPKEKQKHFLQTMTGEPYQLARVYFEVFNRSTVAGIFSRLQCMDYDPDQKRWGWLYHGEAKTLHFLRSYASIPEENHPIVLGSFFSRSELEMFLNVNSFDRAVKGIVFFDRYLQKGLIKKRRLVKVTEIEVVNRYFGPPAGGGLPKHEDFFDRQPVSRTDPEAILKKLERIRSSVKNREEGEKLAFACLEASAREPFPKIERLPARFYEDGIEGLEASLRMRQAIAYQHWMGNVDYTCYDLVQDALHKGPGNSLPEDGEPNEQPKH